MNVNKQPLISVITVVLNDVENIEKTILSVVNQTYSNIEYIIIDGVSTDGTMEIINQYKDSITRIVSESDNGLYDAMNKGANLATGLWISFMNSGDIFFDNYVLHNIFANHNPSIIGYDAIYSDVIANYNSFNKRRYANKISSIWRGQPFSHQAFFVKTSIAKNFPFNLKYSITADYNFIFTIYNKSVKFYYFDHPIAIIDATAGLSKTASFDKLYKQFFEVNKKHTTVFQHFLVRIFFAVHYLYAITRRHFLKNN